MPRTRVYIATSLDGFIAGPDDDLSWLPQNMDEPSDPRILTFDSFIADVGAILMGRNTFDVVESFGGDWPYGETPVLVATNRDASAPSETVRFVSGDINDLVAAALETAAGKDVYIDGGILINEALDHGLIDEITVTVFPTILGDGAPLFQGTRTELEIQHVGRYGVGFQWRAVPAGD